MALGLPVGVHGRVLEVDALVPHACGELEGTLLVGEPSPLPVHARDVPGARLHQGVQSPEVEGEHVEVEIDGRRLRSAVTVAGGVAYVTLGRTTVTLPVKSAPGTTRMRVSPLPSAANRVALASETVPKFFQVFPPSVLL